MKYLLCLISLSLAIPSSLFATSVWYPELVPRRVGVINAIHDHWFGQNQNLTAATDIAGLGFRAIKIWPTEDYLSPDMEAIYRDPAFDVIVLRPLQNSPLDEETGCDGKQYTYYRWENIDYGAVARDLYARVGDLNKVIILTGWEMDNQIKGLGCSNRTPSQSEVDSFVAMIDARQAGVAAAAEDNVHKNLRVYHAIEVSHVLFTPFRVIDEVVPQLAEKPHMVSYSHWNSYYLPDALDHIASVVSPLPRHRIFLGEVGKEENLPTTSQYNRIYWRMDEAFSWGVKLAFMWNYRDQFNCPSNKGLWLRRCDGSLATSYDALVDMQAKYDDP